LGGDGVRMLAAEGVFFRLILALTEIFVVKVLFFCVFFGFGCAAVACAVLCEDILEYRRNEQLIEQGQGVLDRLAALNADYDALLERAGSDPELLGRAAVAMIGAEPNDPNTAYPVPSPAELAAAQEAIEAMTAAGPVEPSLTEKWLGRLSEPRRRVALFLAGAFLIFLSFMFFATPEVRTGERCGTGSGSGEQ